MRLLYADDNPDGSGDLAALGFGEYEENLFYRLRAASVVLPADKDDESVAAGRWLCTQCGKGSSHSVIKYSTSTCTRYLISANSEKQAAKTSVLPLYRPSIGDAEVARKLYLLGKSSVLDLNASITEKDTARSINTIKNLGGDPTNPFVIFPEVAELYAKRATELKKINQRSEDETPYWRTLKANGELNAKYPGGIEAQKEKLEAEGHTIIQKGRTNIKYFVKDYESVLFDLRQDF